jgi:hypothetical protein
MAGSKPRSRTGSEPPVPSELGQPYDGGSEDASGGISDGREPTRVQHGRLERPPNDDHGRGFVGFDQLNGQGSYRAVIWT